MAYDLMESRTKLREGFDPVFWYVHDVLEHEGDIKALWKEPDSGFQYLSEKELSNKEKESRTALLSEGFSEHYKNMNYSAEHALQQVQDRKKELGIKLDLNYRPVITEGSAIGLSRQKQYPSIQ